MKKLLVKVKKIQPKMLNIPFKVLMKKSKQILKVINMIVKKMKKIMKMKKMSTKVIMVMMTIAMVETVATPIIKNQDNSFTHSNIYTNSKNTKSFF